MSMARVVITAVRVECRSISAVAGDYGVSRRWVHELVRRFDTEGEAAFQPRSRRPHHSPNQVPAVLEDEIVRLRKKLTNQGLDGGAETIRAMLADRLAARTPRSEQDPPQLPAVSTIWRILNRRGFVTPQPHKRPRSSWQRFEATQPNERWQADITHWQLADGTEVEILNIIDDHSRLAIASKVRRTTLAPDVAAAFEKAFAHWGTPAGVLTDNGAVFTGEPRGHGEVALERLLRRLRVVFDHSRPYHPQTCGKVERFHQTQKKWLAARPHAKTIRGLQAQVDAFNRYYNNQRPHRAVGRRAPAHAYASRPKATPHGPKIPDHYRLRRDTIDTGGTVTLRHNSRLHHIGLGRLLAGTRVYILTDDLHVRVITREGQLLRDLTLDPSRDYQSRGAKTGPQRPHKRE
jgi:transposase InsO family protein